MGAISDLWDAGGAKAPAEYDEWGEALSDAVDANTDHAADTTNPHEVTAAQAGALATGASAGGDLAGTYPNPTVSAARGIRETDGPTVLTVGAIADGEFLKRDGSTVVGAEAGGDTARDVLAALGITPNALIAYDDFQRPSAVANISGDTAPSGQTWAVSGSGVSINAGGYAEISTTERAAVLPCGLKYVSVRARLAKSSDALSRLALVAAYADVDNCIMLQVDTGGNLVLKRIIGGTGTNMATDVSSPKHDGRERTLIRLDVVVSSLAPTTDMAFVGYVDGRRIGPTTISDSSIVSALGESAGIYGQKATATDILILSSRGIP